MYVTKTKGGIPLRTICGIKLDLSKLFKNILLSSTIIFAIVGLASYIDQKPISQQHLTQTITDNNKNLIVGQNTISITTDKFGELLKIPAKVMDKSGLNSIYINGAKVVKDDQVSRFYYTISDGFLVIRSVPPQSEMDFQAA